MPLKNSQGKGGYTMEYRLRVGNALWQHVIQPYLFQMDPEEAHNATIRMLERIQKYRFSKVAASVWKSPYADMPVTIGGVPWKNPVGIAAGFDKDARVIPFLDALGFGAIEVGTVTPFPQEGNPKPRVYRYPNKKALINRYSFNSEGVNAVAKRLQKLHATYDIKAAIGVSIGKNKLTPTETMLFDYTHAMRILIPVLRPGRDYLKINISSPNTPGLRDTFTILDSFLKMFMVSLKTIADTHNKPQPPVYLKVPPDNVSQDDYVNIVATSAHYGITAIEATNTTTNAQLKNIHECLEEGGLSGEPLRKLSTRILSHMREEAEKHDIDLIGVGGISAPEHVFEKTRAGAKAVQIYTGLVYEGPSLLHNILEKLYNKQQAIKRIRIPFDPGVNMRVSA